ncbi:MAG: CHASE2 domain-containing protein [Thermodesulfobacteriota bacterium]
MIRRLLSFFQTFVGRWVAVVTLVVSFLGLWRPAYTDFLELKFYDLKYRVRGPLTPCPDIAIVGIDDDSLQKVGRWPWSREDIARLILTVKDMGPKVVALDIVFAEREESAAVRSLANLRREIARRGASTPELMALLEKEEHRADVDRRLAQVIAHGPPTILGFFFRDVGGTAAGLQAEQLMGESYIRASTYNAVRLLNTKPSQLPLLGAEGVQVNLPEIVAAAAGGGYFNMLPDADGVVRWNPLAILFGPDLFAPLSLVAPDHYLGRPPLSITLSQLGVSQVRLGSRQVPVDRFGRLLINYLGGPGVFPSYSAAAVMEGRVPPQALKDKIVLIGATAVGIYDLRVTPFSGINPGVEIQATVIDNLLTGRFMRVPPFNRGLSVLIIIMLAIILGLALPRLSAFWSFAFTMSMAAFFIAGNYFMFIRGRQLDLFYPLLQIGAVYLGFTIHRFMLEEQERLRIRRAFEAYVAPTVVQEMLKHPDNLRLGGERREITIMFTDIRGFTTLSENLAPEELVATLHDFLNPMSNIIIQHEGTIDKYIGDAIMALFGAPLELPDHAGRACRTALDMMATLGELDRKWAEQGRPQVRVGIGINSGVVAVGNMGSDRLFDYTAIGDNVNLASRLEGLNKYYGTNILISEATVRNLNGDFILRSVDLVQVKGKAQPLEVFDLISAGTPEPDWARFLEIYHQGLTLYRQGHWSQCASALEEALSLRPQDQLAQRYLLLSQKYQQNPPGADWSPVTVMTEK